MQARHGRGKGASRLTRGMSLRTLLRPAVGLASVGLCAAAYAGGLIAQPKMGEPLPELSADQLTAFNVGLVAYDTNLLASQGLGPIFNAKRCSLCHAHPLGGFGNLAAGVGPQVTNIRAGVLVGETFDPLEELGGSLFQQRGQPLECRETIPPEANIIAGRTGIGMLGYGLVEAIPDSAILANEDPDDLDGDGISGRAHMVEALEDPGNLRVGRFGWKAQYATILSISADAALEELGLTNRLRPEENDPNGINPPNLGDPDFCDPVPDPEDRPALGNGVDKEFIDVVTDFQRFLAAPPQTPRSGMTGETVFNEIGCAACHVATFSSADDAGLEDALRNKVIHPYSDFLLHDMGNAADFIAQGDAGIREMRTRPLWGMTIRSVLWHDAQIVGDNFKERAMEAIAAHGSSGSESRPAKLAFDALSVEDQDALIAFLLSLGRPEFDHDDNRVIDIADYLDFLACAAAGVTVTADDPCAVHDVDQDGDVDVDDLHVFATVYEGEETDCNENAINDLVDIFQGVSVDDDSDGVPDECELETIDADLVGAQVSIGTLLSGDVTSLVDSDDVHLEIASGPSGNSESARISVQALSSETTVHRLDVTVEASADLAGVDLFVDLRNWDLARWDTIATLSMTVDDVEHVILDIADPNAYVRDAGNVNVRLISRIDADDAPDGYILRLDHVEILVSP